ncbi:imidazoleglycerol-phosphate dehydratase HisB [Neisseria sp. N95_16]|uniref:Imidazoleglycerol-phosphate dehydratase n=1 Tax=Neisseria brasiliensis TaxID=2666100 RepID=A0A5Q3S127_9NEIS|nr:MULTISPECIES: imidazoleglycerol-phosphate dehydratase HisB [Neisseria]MRN38732.1 imidazoleglycerol-phosphate dehydratase HisB [Neisseria brasiliensis]PJO10349.1 imidazoleglycerol-phosphate dehydratase HisB [Neisseria sp. N95_16]PJO78876.1 imidazoleglycerol-phosphate dehydratase HisB [Neisseria sp. N177_16]QGL25635.1 imidazoleglycerol-phosphate dehydratase HisB [Neisseria brasiliensis]
MNKTKRHLDNLYLLIEEAGSLTKLARQCGYENAASLSQLKRRLEEQVDDEKARGIRPSLAQKLEQGMSKRKGWLDRDHSKDQEKAAAQEQEQAAEAANLTLIQGGMPSENDVAPIATEGRYVSVTRNTSETQITVQLNLDGSGIGRFDTGVPFLDHMLDQIARHGLIDLDIVCKGDLHIDDHHTVEDIGITVGQALKQALGNKMGIRRYGHAYVPLDEALSRVVLDLSGRPGLEYNIEFTRAMIGRFDVDLFSEFFHGLVNHSMMTLHIDNLRGKNAHHQAETVFKAFGRALRMAVEYDERMSGKMPSTKGTLTA